MTLLGVPNDVVERIASILLRLREGGEKYGESCRDRRAMDEAFRAVLSLSMTCKELRRLLTPTAMHREARARRDTIIWPSLRVAESAPRTPGSASHLYSAQRDEEKHSKAQLRTLREAIEAFVCGKPRRHHRRAFLENAGAKRKCEVRMISGPGKQFDSFEVDVIGVVGGFLFQSAPDTGPNYDELRIWCYDDPTVQDYTVGKRVGTISSPDKLPDLLNMGMRAVVKLFETPSGVDLLVPAHKSDDAGRMQIFYEHYWLDRSKGTMNLLFSEPMMSYAVDDEVFEQMPITLLLDEYGGHHALLNKYDIDSEGESHHDVTLGNWPGYQIQFLDGVTISSVEYEIWNADAAAATTTSDRNDYLNDWIHHSTVEIRGYVAVSTGMGMRIHSGELFETTEDVTCPIGQSPWGPLLPVTFSPNSQFLIARTWGNATGERSTGLLIFAQNPATGRFNDYPYVRLSGEHRQRSMESPVFTECSRYCVFQTRAEWHYIDFVSVFARLRPYAGVVSHAGREVDWAFGRPLAPGIGNLFPKKQPYRVIFESGGVTVLCNDDSVLRLTTARRPSNLGPPGPVAVATKP